MFISFESLGVFHNEGEENTSGSQKDRMICFENFRLIKLQSVQLEHCLHSACRGCIKHYLESLASAVVTCPYCRLPVDSVLYNSRFVKM